MNKCCAALVVAASAAIASSAWTQTCRDEQPSLVPRWRDPYHVCTPEPRGGFGFWSRATSLVGADSFLMPKYASRGFTYTARFSLANDFNSAPRLRQATTYVAPLPYTHPPIYSPQAGAQEPRTPMLQMSARESVFIEY